MRSNIVNTTALPNTEVLSVVPNAVFAFNTVDLTKHEFSALYVLGNGKKFD